MIVQASIRLYFYSAFKAGIKIYFKQIKPAIMKRVLLYTTLLLLLISCGKNTEVAKLLPAIKQ